MKQKILLITGWGVGIAVLDPLKQALQGSGYEVELIDIFNALDPQVLQQKVQYVQTFDVLIGWSLGGQLAALLAHDIEQQYAQKKVLISLASNPCFVVQDTWADAMDLTTFQHFKQSFEQNADATLKRFAYMLTQGAVTAKQDFIQLQNLVEPLNQCLLKQGLELLACLNVVDKLKNYKGAQYHIFAAQDALVPCKVFQNIQNFDAKFLSVEQILGSHSFPIFQSQEISDKICQYLQKIKQTD